MYKGCWNLWKFSIILNLWIEASNCSSIIGLFFSSKQSKRRKNVILILSFRSRISGTIIFCLLIKSKHLLLIFRSLQKVPLFISLRHPLILDMTSILLNSCLYFQCSYKRYTSIMVLSFLLQEVSAGTTFVFILTTISPDIRCEN